jgi:hypothetical protein
MHGNPTLRSAGGEDGDLPRTTVGPRNEPAPPRPDRRRRPLAGRGRGPGRAPAPGHPDHRQRRPADPADHPAPVCPALAADLPGGKPWPTLTSSPGRTSSGPSTPARGRCRTSRGRTSPGPTSRAAATRPGLDPVYLRSGGRTTSPLHQSTSGADSPAVCAGESAPSVSGWANLTVRTPLRGVDPSIEPPANYRVGGTR